jgi:hypothetical protein
MADAIGASAARHGTAGLLALRVGCAPLPGARRSDHDAERDCEAFNDAVIERIERSPEIGDVVLAARWGLLSEGLRYGGEPGETVFLTDSASADASLAENRQVLARTLTRSVEKLVGLGKRVWIVAAVPEVGWDVPSVLAISRRFGREAPRAPSQEDYARRQAFVLATLRDLDALPGVEILRPERTLCATGPCEVVREGRPLYFDSHHLSRTGATLLEPMFAAIFVR